MNEQIGHESSSKLFAIRQLSTHRQIIHHAFSASKAPKKNPQNREVNAPGITVMSYTTHKKTKEISSLSPSISTVRPPHMMIHQITPRTPRTPPIPYDLAAPKNAPVLLALPLYPHRRLLRDDHLPAVVAL